MRFMSTKNHQQGFTLVEVAIVVPMIVIIVVGILALLITLVSTNVQQSTRSSLVNNVRFALGSIEKDVDSSSLFFPSTLPSSTYQDFNQPGNSGTYQTAGTPAPGVTASTLNTLFIQGYNQISDPTDTSGTKIVGAYKGTPPCSGTTLTQVSNIAGVAVIYFVNSGTLYRRTIIDKTNPTTCGPQLIKQSCPSGSDANNPACTAKDAALLGNVTQFKVDYYLGANDVTAMNAYVPSPSPTIDQAKAIAVTLTAAANAGGKNVSHTSTLRMTRSNN